MPHYICKNCGEVFNALSNTFLEGWHRLPDELVFAIQAHHAKLPRRALQDGLSNYYRNCSDATAKSLRRALSAAWGTYVMRSLVPVGNAHKFAFVIKAYPPRAGAVTRRKLRPSDSL
jgi:hypothetical protein